MNAELISPNIAKPRERQPASQTLQKVPYRHRRSLQNRSASCTSKVVSVQSSPFVSLMYLQALKRYNITDDWREYALYIVHGDQERCLGLEERPLLLFKQLDKEGRKPMFMLRRHAAPEEGWITSGVVHHHPPEAASKVSLDPLSICL